MTSSTQAKCKFDIIGRIGGKTEYDMTVFHLSERLLQDSKLESLFRGIHIDTLCKLQEEMLSLAISDLGFENKQRRLSSALLHHYRLFDLGMNDEHFGIIADHLKESLCLTWVEESIIDDFIKCYNDLRVEIFGNGGDNTTMEKSALEAMLGLCHEDEVEECEMPLTKSEKPSHRTTFHCRFARRRSNNMDEANSSNKKEARRLSGENLLAMLRLNDFKRSKPADSCQ